MIFLSKDGNDEYINMFSKGCGYAVTSTESFDYNSSNDPIVLRGILKHKIIKKCWKDQRDFYYIDSGYFGNDVNSLNPQGWKVWHRIVKNNIQHHTLTTKPNDRFDKLKKNFQPWKKHGRKILIAVPDIKPCKFYNIDLEQWILNTVEIIKKHTDRPIVIRQRASKRSDRIITNTLQQALTDDVFALVTFNSIAAIESIFFGVPAFTLSPIHSAYPVTLQDLSKIETPYYVDKDKLYNWACHLAYGQFHISELKNGTALKIIREYD